MHDRSIITLLFWLSASRSGEPPEVLCHRWIPELELPTTTTFKKLFWFHVIGAYLCFALLEILFVLTKYFNLKRCMATWFSDCVFGVVLKIESFTYSGVGPELWVTLITHTFAYTRTNFVCCHANMTLSTRYTVLIGRPSGAVWLWANGGLSASLEWNVGCHSRFETFEWLATIQSRTINNW